MTAAAEREVLRRRGEAGEALLLAGLDELLDGGVDALDVGALMLVEVQLRDLLPEMYGSSAA